MNCIENKNDSKLKKYKRNQIITINVNLNNINHSYSFIRIKMLCSSNFLSKNISDNGNRSVKRNKTIKNLNFYFKMKRCDWCKWIFE